MKAFAACLVAFLLGLTGCAPTSTDSPPEGANIVTVIGAIHGQHRSSERYSLNVLRDAIVKFDPDVVLVELPSDRFAIASANFEKFGEVRESRADDFLELTDVVFPLREKSGFTMIPVAAWTPDIAADRRAKEKQLEKIRPARKTGRNIRRLSSFMARRFRDDRMIPLSSIPALMMKRSKPVRKATSGCSGMILVPAAGARSMLRIWPISTPRSMR